MPSLIRLLHVLRKGPRGRRIQAWAGLVLLVGTGLWLIWKFVVPILWAIALALVGFFLLRRALRDSRPSS